MSTEYLQQTYRFIKDFLLKILNKEFLVFLFFLAVSFGFWLIITLNETYERDIYMPLRLINVPNNVVITDPLPDSVKVTVRDRGYSLIPYYYSDAVQPIYLRFSTYAKANGKGSIPPSELQKMIKNMLYSSTSIVSVKAEKLDFTFNYGLSKRVPVVFDGDVKMEEQYYLSHVVCKPESIYIYASREVLDSIKEVYTDFFVAENVADTLVKYLSLKKINGVKMVPDKVKVTFYSDVLTEKVIEVPITSINMPDGLLLRTFPGHVSVKVVVGKGNMLQVRPENFKAVVDYKEVADHPSDKCNVQLITMPRGIVTATLETKSVDYLIEKQE